MGDVSPEFKPPQQKTEKSLSGKNDKSVKSSLKRLAGKVIMRTPLAGLILSSGNVDNPNFPPPNIKEPTPVTAPLPTFSTPSTESSVATHDSEKKVLTDIDFLQSIFINYLDLEADPLLKGLKDLNTIDYNIVKTVKGEFDDESIPPGMSPLPGTNFPIGDFGDKLGGKRTVLYQIVPNPSSPSLAVSVIKKDQRVINTSIIFSLTKDGELITGARPYNPPARFSKEERLIRARNASRFFKHKPFEWKFISSLSSKYEPMTSELNLPNGKHIKYEVSTYLGSDSIQVNMTVSDSTAY